MYITARHFVYVRRTCGSWHQFFSLFDARKTQDIRALLPPEAVRNLDLTKRLNKLGLYVFGFMVLIFICGMLWGGWTGNPS
jgi:hypothetical protein